MANELKRVYHGTTLTLESSGDAANAAAIVQCETAYNLATYGDYPNARFVLNAAFDGATTLANLPIELVIRPINIDGTGDAAAPTATYRPHAFGAFRISASASALNYYVDAYDLPREGEVYLYNATGQQLSAAWTLKMTAFSVVPT
jgi:hypothetical protein